MNSKGLIISLLSLFVIVSSAAYAANDKKWINPITKTSGLKVPAPGLFLTPSTVPTHSDLAEGVIWADDANNTVKYYNGSSSIDLGVQAGGSIDLDGAFDNGKVINGANSLANAVQFGDGTDAILLHTEGAGDVRFTTNGTSDLTIAPDGGDTSITGTLSISSTLGVTGITTLSNDLDVTVTDTTANGVYVDASTITTGNAFLIEYDAATMNGGTALNITEDTVTVFKVEEDGNTTISGTLDVVGLSTLGSLTVSAGGLTISAGGVTVNGDSLITASTTTGQALNINGDTVTTGDIVRLDYEAAAMNGGKVINVREATDSVFSVGEDGKTVIAGTAAGTDALTITAGDITMSSGRFDISGDASNADLINVTRNNGATGGDGIGIAMGSATVGGEGVQVSWSGAGTGDAFQAIMTNNLQGRALDATLAGIRQTPGILINGNNTDAGTDDNAIRVVQDGLLDSDVIWVGYTTANSTGNAYGADMNTNLGGFAYYVDQGGTARTGGALQVNDDSTAAHSLIDLDDSGSGATTGFDYTGSYNGSPAGDAVKLTLDDGDNLDTGLLNLSVGTGDRGALIKYTSTGTDAGTTSYVYDHTQSGILDSAFWRLVYDTAASTGDGIVLEMGTNVAGRALRVNSAATGVDNEGSVFDVDATGNLIQGANVVRIDSSGDMAHADTRVVEINETGADQAGSYVMGITSTNNGGIILSSAAADHAIDVTQGIVDMNGNKIEFYDSAVGMYSQADTFLDIYADGGLRIGDSSAGAPTNYVTFASDGSFTATGTARRTKKVWLGSEVFWNETGSVAAVAGTGFKSSWEMTDGAADYVTGSWYIPDNWVTGTVIQVYIYWSSTAGGANVGVWDLHYVPLAEGEDMNGSGTNLADQQDTSAGNDLLNVSPAFTIAGGDIAAGDQLILRPGRVGSAAADTLGQTADFLGIQISYTANTW